MYSGLDNDGTQLLRLLISRLANAVPNRPETFISYKEVHTLLGLRQMGPTFGVSLRYQGMDSLAGWAAARGLPAITGLIVHEDARVPGSSYFTSNGRDPNTDFKWWENEIVKAKAQDWLSLDQPAVSDGKQAGNFSTKHIAPAIEKSTSASADTIEPSDLSNDKTLSEEATRIADLVYGRVTASGYIFKGVRPTRSAPENLLLQIAERLRKVPLNCALCGGLMQLQPSNKLLQPSPDRIDSDAASYGPENFQLVHLACNLGKNNATAAQFEEWLQLAKSVGQGNK